MTVALNFSDPFERLLSTYRNKFEFAYSDYFRERYGKVMKARADNTSSNTNERAESDRIPSFEDFLNFVASENTEKNEHWQAVADICHPCRIKFDFVG